MPKDPRKVCFELADGFTHVERALASGRLATVTATTCYETEDPQEIAELDQTFGLQRAKTKPARGSES